jgi:hypothetical protein
MAYVFPIVAATIHAMVAGLVVYVVPIDISDCSRLDDFDTHTFVTDLTSLLCVLLNFFSVFLLLFLLGIALAAYARQLTHTYYFGVITSAANAEALDLPTLPLHTGNYCPICHLHYFSVENIMAWMKIRAYIRVQQSYSST